MGVRSCFDAAANTFENTFNSANVIINQTLGLLSSTIQEASYEVKICSEEHHAQIADRYEKLQQEHPNYQESFKKFLEI